MLVVVVIIIVVIVMVATGTWILRVRIVIKETVVLVANRTGTAGSVFQARSGIASNVAIANQARGGVFEGDAVSRIRDIIRSRADTEAVPIYVAIGDGDLRAARDADAVVAIALETAIVDRHMRTAQHGHALAPVADDEIAQHDAAIRTGVNNDAGHFLACRVVPDEELRSAGASDHRIDVCFDTGCRFHGRIAVGAG